MEVGDLATWATVAVSLGIGIWGAVTAQIANRRSKESRELAVAANSIAEKAVREAAKANGIAKHANNLSENANALVERTVVLGEEDWFVTFEPDWDREANTLTLLNKGRDAAGKLSVTITGKDLHHVLERNEDLPAGKQVLVALDEVRKQKAEHARRLGERSRRSAGSGILSIGAAFQADLQINVRWRTGAGFPQFQAIELKVR